MNIDKLKLQEIINKTHLVFEDIKLLKEGEWIPDKESCNASLDNIQDIKNFLKKLKKDG